MSDNTSWKIKNNLDIMPCDDFWYNLTDGGYIKPSDILEDDYQVQELEDAIELIKSFKNKLEDDGILEEM